MKKIIVFDVENVLFNVKNVEKRVDDRKKLMEGMSDFDRREEMKKMDNYMKGSIVEAGVEVGREEEPKGRGWRQVGGEEGEKAGVDSLKGRWHLEGDTGWEIVDE